MEESFLEGCSGYFFPAPLEWMGELPGLEDKLQCPKCEGRIGSYNWAGASVGGKGWVAPSIQLSRSKIDQRVAAEITDVLGHVVDASAVAAAAAATSAYDQFGRKKDDVAAAAAAAAEEPLSMFDQLRVDDQGAEEEEENDEVQEEGEAAEFSLTEMWRMDNVEHFPNDICREYAASFAISNFSKIKSLLADGVTLSSPVGESAGRDRVAKALQMTRGRMAEDVQQGTPKASGPSSSKVQFEFVSKDGKMVQIIDDIVVQRRTITTITRTRVNASA
jgi:hypothetical protein